MDMYETKPRYLIAIIACLIGYFLYSKFDGFLSIVVAAPFAIVVWLCFVPIRGDVGFSKDQIRIAESWTKVDLFEKSDVLDVSITNKKIYVQTKHKNYTINKSYFESDKFDQIVNEFLKVKAENNLTK